MRRPRPLRRLVDGRPDDPGRTVARRFTLLVAPAIIVSNVVGALVVFVLAVWAVPSPELEDPVAVQLSNLIAGALYVTVAVVVGTLWGVRSFRPSRKWLREDRPPDPKQQKAALRLPLRLLRVNATLWLLATVAFTALNAIWSWELALKVGLTVLLGGVTTCAASYLLAERINRPVAARALSGGVPERPVLPGVTSRAILAWALGSGVPVLGLGLVAIASLAGGDVSEDDLAVTMLGLGGVALAVGLLVTWQAARAVADPVVSVREALQEIEGGNLEAEVPVYDGSELGLLQAGFNSTASGLREREEVRDLFGRHVGEEVARAALDRGIELGGEERDVAVLFVDLVGSTELAAESSPKEVVELLNSFFAVVVEVVEQRDGWVNKFEGDAALAVFGAPIQRDDAAACALSAGRELADRLRSEVSELEAGIGISAGRAVAGNVGAERRFEYTVIGDPVNEAARLCDLAKEKPGRVLASGTAVEQAGGRESERWSVGERVELRGRSSETLLATPG